MALPTVEKTWDFSQANKYWPCRTFTLSNDGGNSQPLLWTIKEQLKTWGWTVKGSCVPGIGYGMDNVDRWTDPSKLDFWWTEYAWIVMVKPNAAGAGKNFEMVWQLQAPNGEGWNMNTACSFNLSGVGGFSGGDTWNRPTATYEGWVNNSLRYTNALYEIALHMMRSTDGECERIAIMQDNWVGSWISFEKPKSPVTGWSHPFLFTWYANNTTYGEYNDNARYWGFDNGSAQSTNVSKWFQCYLASEGHVSACTGERQLNYNELNGENLIQPISFVSETAGKRGYVGDMYDLWFGNSNRKTGDTYPGDETAQFAQIHHFVHPWKGDGTPFRTL